MPSFNLNLTLLATILFFIASTILFSLSELTTGQTELYFLDGRHIFRWPNTWFILNQVVNPRPIDGEALLVIPKQKAVEHISQCMNKLNVDGSCLIPPPPLKYGNLTDQFNKHIFNLDNGVCFEVKDAELDFLQHGAGSLIHTDDHTVPLRLWVPLIKSKHLVVVSKCGEISMNENGMAVLFWSGGWMEHEQSYHAGFIDESVKAEESHWNAAVYNILLRQTCIRI